MATMFNLTPDTYTHMSMFSTELQPHLLRGFFLNETKTDIKRKDTFTAIKWNTHTQCTHTLWQSNGRPWLLTMTAWKTEEQSSCFVEGEWGWSWFMISYTLLELCLCEISQFKVSSIRLSVKFIRQTGKQKNEKQKKMSDSAGRYLISNDCGSVVSSTNY